MDEGEKLKNSAFSIKNKSKEDKDNLDPLYLYKVTLFF